MFKGIKSLFTRFWGFLAESGGQYYTGFGWSYPGYQAYENVKADGNA